MSWTPKKKKVQSTRIKGAQKLVRIDFRTQIMVDVDIPDEIARDRYLTRLGKNVLYGFKAIGETNMTGVVSEQLHGQEALIGTLEEIQAMIADNTEPAEED